LQYLLLILGPIIVGYASYSLIYETHKGWYSWMLQVFTSVISHSLLPLQVLAGRTYIARDAREN
jgi:hypothetical protein